MPPGVQETSLIIIIVLMLLGGAFIGIVIWLLRRYRAVKQVPLWGTPLDDLPTRADYKSNWLLGIAFVVALFAIFAWTDERDRNLQARLDHQVRVQRLIAAGYFHPKYARLTVDLNDCGPRTDGATDQVLMAIATQADGQHTVTGCSRTTQRQYGIKTAKGYP